MFAEAGLLSNALAWALLLSAPFVDAVANIDMTAIGASTTLSQKPKVCNILDYGGVADGKMDVGPAISKAFSSCVSGNAATLYVPKGNYSLATGVKLSGASGWAFQLDGLITLTSDGSFSGNAFVIQQGSDIEFFSSNNLGAINGQGYIARRDSTGQNARLVRFISTSHVSVHNIILVDAPAFHLVFNDVTDLDLYYITVRGGNIGGTDGIDLTCTDNCYLHDFEVTNRDECVSVKSPSNNVLIENAYCNHSGGMSIGSLTANIADASDAAAVSNITMRNIYSFECTQMLMIKTYPGGTGAEGYVKDSLFENFWAYNTTYALDIDQYWQSKTTPDTGAVALSDLTFRNWTGSLANGLQRGAVVIRGSDIVPSQDITLEGFSMWTLYGSKVVNQCKNVYGTGECIKAATGTATYTSSVTSTVAPTNWVAAASPVWGVSGYGSTNAIPIYTPAVFWPVSSLKNAIVSAPAKTTKTSSATKVSATASAVASVKSLLISTSSTSRVSAATGTSTSSAKPVSSTSSAFSLSSHSSSSTLVKSTSSSQISAQSKAVTLSTKISNVLSASSVIASKSSTLTCPSVVTITNYV